MPNIIKQNDQSHALPVRETQLSPFSLIDRFFDDSFDPFGFMGPSLLGTRFSSVSSVFPKVDVFETDSEIKVVANVPGIDPEKIDIEVGEDYLSISGQINKEITNEDTNGKIYRHEREFGEFRREFSLPARVNKGSIVAKAKNGVLSITLPKSEDESKAKVKVEVE
ncbi:MAG TPA: Hsp20/alpha crystallin family protein [Candidatus Paceibacterota bacterium]|nr:Hsp20/alpha crystallin family protein [Candidatus Paceibacterota bacterium]